MLIFNELPDSTVKISLSALCSANAVNEPNGTMESTITSTSRIDKNFDLNFVFIV